MLVHKARFKIKTTTPFLCVILSRLLIPHNREDGGIKWKGRGRDGIEILALLSGPLLAILLLHQFVIALALISWLSSSGCCTCILPVVSGLPCPGCPVAVLLGLSSFRLFWQFYVSWPGLDVLFWLTCFYGPSTAILAAHWQNSRCHKSTKLSLGWPIPVRYRNF